MFVRHHYRHHPCGSHHILVKHHVATKLREISVPLCDITEGKLWLTLSEKWGRRRKGTCWAAFQSAAPSLHCTFTDLNRFSSVAKRLCEVGGIGKGEEPRGWIKSGEDFCLHSSQTAQKVDSEEKTRHGHWQLREEKNFDFIFHSQAELCTMFPK